jgi:hypothetical protein
MGASPAHRAFHTLTAVQLRAGATVAARLLWGAPLRSLSGKHGEIALLPAGEIAAYLVESGREMGFYLFRTGTYAEPTLVPGVQQPVRLFLASRRRRAATRTRNFLRKLSSYGHDPSTLSDLFWTRAAGALAARARADRQLLPYLLARETADDAARIRARHGGNSDGRLRADGVAPHPELHPEPPPRGVLASTRSSRWEGRDR